MQPDGRVLVLTTNHVGNNLFCTAGIRLLKRYLPTVQFDVVALSGRGASVFAHNPDVHTVYRCFFKQGVRRLARGYDLTLGLHHDVAGPYLEHLENTVLLERPSPHMHRTEAMLQSLGALLGCA